MYQTTKGLVLRVSPYNDADAILTILTAEQGMISAKARGVRRKSSPLAAPCQLLCYCEFTLFAYKDFFTINEAHCIALFTGLRKDLQKLSLGTYFAQATETLSQEDMPNPELLALLLNCLHGLSELNISEKQIKAVFELRSICLAGYTPDLSVCHICGASDHLCLNISEGCLECSDCIRYRAEGLRIPISAGVLDAMRYITTCESKKVFSFSLPDSSMDQLSNITEVYFSTQLERGFSALDFYKTLLFTSDEPFI